MPWTWARLAAAIVGLSGVIAGFVVNVDRAMRQGQDLGLVLANYFSLFTVVTTILCAGVLLAAAARSQIRPDATREPFGIALASALVSGPVILLGIVYNTLLRGIPSEVALADSAGIHLMDVWAIETLHVVLPLYLVVDLAFARRRQLPWWAVATVLAYPVGWLTYTLVRGALSPDPLTGVTGWYPYPFLDPTVGGGWPSVLVYVVVMLIALVAIAAVIVGTGRLRDRSRIPRAPLDRVKHGHEGGRVRDHRR